MRRIDAWHVEPFCVAINKTREVDRPASDGDHIAARLGDVDDVTGVSEVPSDECRRFEILNGGGLLTRVPSVRKSLAIKHVTTQEVEAAGIAPAS